MSVTQDVKAAESAGGAQIAEANGAAQQMLDKVRPFPGGQQMAVGGLIPRNLDEAARFAQLVYKSTFIPKQFRDNAGDVLAAVMFGADLGLPPMQALQTIAVINGKPSIYGDGFLAVIYSLPQFADHDEYFVVDGARVEPDALVSADLRKDTTAAVCVFTRRGRSKPVVRKFSVEQAKTAQLWTKDGPWKQYPERMLMFRARGFAGRDAFPDGLKGIDLAEAAADIETTAVHTEHVPMPQRITETVAAAEPARDAAAADTDPTTGEMLPDGLDRVVNVTRAPRKSDPDKFWWAATTQRGLSLYTFSTTVGPKLEEAKAAGALVKLAVKNPDAQNRIEVIDVAAIA